MASSTTSAVYLHVIEDVINKVRDEFAVNDGPDETVLDMLQRFSPTTQDPSQHSNNSMHSSLYKAVKDGKVEDLDQDTDLFDTQLTPNHNTILHVAAHFEKLECVATILDKKPCLLHQVNANFENPLHIAVRERHYGFQALIEHARKLDLEPESGAGTRLEILRAINVDGDTALHLAVREEDAKIVSLLVAEDPDFQHPPNKAEETPLYLATERYNGDSMIESILTSSSPDHKGPNDRTALHAAAIFGNAVAIRYLLEDNRNRFAGLIDQADTEGWTPLHYAAYSGHHNTVRELLKGNNSVGYTRTTEKHDKSTALHIAAANNNDEAMKEILSHCPDCWEMVNSKGKNILHIAVDMRARLVIEYIIKIDWLKSLMNRKDFEGNTPLHLLASLDVDMDDLINHPRANIYAFNNRNWNPAEVARLADKDSYSWRLIVSGRRNVAEGNQKNRRERKKKGKELKKTSESLMLVAALIATITFAAAFAIPGGYNAHKGPEEGMAVLVRQASFKAFIIANTIAVTCSTSSVVYYVFAAFYFFDEHDQGRRYAKGFYLILIAIVAMMVGFISGTYAMLVHSLGLAIATSIIASATFLIYHLELKELLSVWCPSVPW